jgi:hypothetical protein
MSEKANHFKYFTDLQCLKAVLPTVTFSFELSMMTSRFLQSSNAQSSMCVTLDGIYISVNPLHLPNAPYPILVTLDGIFILVKPLQPLNALLPILVTLDGIFMLVKPLQPVNAHTPILVTLVGIFTLDNPLHSENAQLSILVTLDGISNFPFFAPGTQISFVFFLSYNTPFSDE